MMVFYHMELARHDKIERFIPRVPDLIMAMENKTTPRICVSKTIEGCLSAAPWGSLTLETHALGKLFRVYVFETEDYMEPFTLANHYGVLDAIANEEYWITKEIEPTDDFLIYISNFSYKTSEMIDGAEHTLIDNVHWEIVREDEVGNIIDLSTYAKDECFWDIVELVIEDYFVSQDEYLEDFMEDISLYKGSLKIHRKEPFYKKLFLDIFKTEYEECKLSILLRKERMAKTQKLA